MTTTTWPLRVWHLEWEASIAEGEMGQLELIWTEIHKRHARCDDVDAVIASAPDPDAAGQAIDELVNDAFRAGFESAGVVERLGWPSSSTGYEPVLRAVVEAAGTAQMPGHIEGRRFIVDAPETDR